VKKVFPAPLDLAVLLVCLVKLVSLAKQEIVVALVIPANLVPPAELVKTDFQERKVTVVSLVCPACVYLMDPTVPNLDKLDQQEPKESAVHPVPQVILALLVHPVLKVPKVIAVLMEHLAAPVKPVVMVSKETVEITDDQVIPVHRDFPAHKVTAERKVNQVQKVNPVAQSPAHLVLTVTQVKLVFQELKVNVVYVVFLVYLATQQLAAVNLARKDLSAHRVPLVPLASKVLPA